MAQDRLVAWSQPCGYVGTELVNNSFIKMPTNGALRKPQGASWLVTCGRAGRWHAPAQWGQRLLHLCSHLPRVAFIWLCWSVSFITGCDLKCCAFRVLWVIITTYGSCGVCGTPRLVAWGLWDPRTGSLGFVGPQGW